jgi:hypothetical protein
LPSAALKGLNDRLKDVDQLMAAHTAIAGPKPGRKFEVIGINRAAILMLSSHFEGYLEDVMAEALKSINSALQAPTLTKGFHNPWPDRIDELFEFLGMEKPSRNISWQKAGNQAVRNNLEKLVRMRNQLAHGTTGVTVYKDDITRFRGYIEGFSERFDKAVRAQVKEISGKVPWPG